MRRSNLTRINTGLNGRRTMQATFARSESTQATDIDQKLTDSHDKVLGALSNPLFSSGNRVQHPVLGTFIITEITPFRQGRPEYVLHPEGENKTIYRVRVGSALEREFTKI